MSRKEKQTADNEKTWINPVGGYGDILMISGVLKLVVDNNPQRQFNLVRRTKYLTFLKGHPAIAQIGYPPKEANIVGTDYWAKESLGGNDQRAFQILARIFGLKTPVNEILYIPQELEDDPLLFNMIPWGEKNVLIAPGSDSPRKIMAPEIWHHLVDMLKANGFFVLQAGRLKDVHIRNAYSALGLTTPYQLIALLRKFDAIVTPDNFIMHAAHLVGARAVVLWGPTLSEEYGYEGQLHLKGDRVCEFEDKTDCLTGSSNNGVTVYGNACPVGKDQCMNRIPVEKIFAAVKEQLKH
jgi:ADP-heptose:LPS heptosyltransferase